MRIRDLVARRTDLSTFLVHLTRAEGAETAKARLEGIIAAQQIEARSPYGSAVSALTNAHQPTDSQKVVCFTETPLEHINLLLQEVEERRLQFAPYGIALPKLLARKRGVNPVWYLDITPGHDWLTVPLNQLIDAAIATGTFGTQPIAKLAPFIEQMGQNPPQYKKEFWWEREWRHAGNFALPERFIILAPEADWPGLGGLAVARGYTNPQFIDPVWGLEEIIARFAEFRPDEIGAL